MRIDYAPIFTLTAASTAASTLAPIPATTLPAPLNTLHTPFWCVKQRSMEMHELVTLLRTCPTGQTQRPDAFCVRSKQHGHQRRLPCDLEFSVWTETTYEYQWSSTGLWFAYAIHNVIQNRVTCVKVDAKIGSQVENPSWCANA